MTPQLEEVFKKVGHACDRSADCKAQQSIIDILFNDTFYAYDVNLKLNIEILISFLVSGFP